MLFETFVAILKLFKRRLVKIAVSKEVKPTVSSLGALLWALLIAVSSPLDSFYIEGERGIVPE